MDVILRDVFYVGSILFAWVSGWIKFNNKFISQSKDIETNKKDIEKLSSFFKKVLLDDNGEIRLVDKKTFNTEIKKGDIEHRDINKQLIEVDKKLLLIIYHMGIDEEGKRIHKM